MHQQEAIHQETLPKQIYRPINSNLEIVEPSQYSPPYPSLLRYTYLNSDEGWIFIVMEFCDKGNVSSFQSSKEGGVFEVR